MTKWDLSQKCKLGLILQKKKNQCNFMYYQNRGKTFQQIKGKT